MQISDYILISSAIIVVIGWFVNGILNRKHEIAKRRSDYRIETLKNYILFYIEAQKKESLNNFNNIQVSFLLYGYNDEINLISEIAKLITTQPNNSRWYKLMNELNILVRNRLRTELGLPKVTVCNNH